MPDTTLRTGAGTETGRQRASNEDAYLCLPASGIFAVIDGVGGHAGGEVAAAEAREAIRRRLEHCTGAPGDRLREAVTNANNAIYWRSQEDLELAGMACVLTVALIEDARLFVAHVGDTRLYKVRDLRIQKLTRDHSFVGIREDQAELSEYEAMHHPRRNEILRDVGSELHEPDDDHFIDLFEGPFEPDAALLLCTDGLTDLVPARELQRLLYEHAGDPQTAVDALIQAANEAGGKDNITAIVVEGPAFGKGPTAASRSMETGSAREKPTPLPREVRPPPAPDLVPSWSPWRYYLYGVGSVVALLGAAYVAFLLWQAAPTGGQPGATPGIAPPVASIGGLLARAAPGDTVWIPPGTYPEVVRLRDGIVLRSTETGGARLVPTGAPGDTVAVLADHIMDAAFIGFAIGPDTRGPDTIAPDSFAVGILVRNARVRLQGVRVTGARQAGVAIETEATLPLSDVVLQDSEISGNAGPGVTVRGGQRIALLDNRIQANGQAGILLLGDAIADVRGNTISGNGGNGIEIRLLPDSTLARLRRANTFQVDGTTNRGEPVHLVFSGHHSP